MNYDIQNYFLTNTKSFLIFRQIVLTRSRGGLDIYTYKME